MSYIKPKLIEPKIVKLITNKLEEKKNKIIINNQIKEQQVIQEIINMLDYPVNVKQGKTYHGLEKL